MPLLFHFIYLFKEKYTHSDLKRWTEAREQKNNESTKAESNSFVGFSLMD